MFVGSVGFINEYETLKDLDRSFKIERGGPVPLRSNHGELVIRIVRRNIPRAHRSVEGREMS